MFEEYSFPQSFRKAIEIKKKIPRDLALNRYTVKNPINLIYNGLKLKGSNENFPSVQIKII